jgi:hypothetical protein
VERLQELAMAAKAATQSLHPCARCVARDAQVYLRLAQESPHHDTREHLLQLAEDMLAAAAKLGGD